ncbi:hypothetical protein B566_EDAN017766, partial [Ephemera danica]
MAAKVRLKDNLCVICPLLWLSLVSDGFGMFDHRICSHVPPKPDEDRESQAPGHIDTPLRILLYYDESVF